MTDQMASHRARFEADPEAVASFEWLEETHFLAEDWELLADCYRHRLSAPSLESQPGARAQLNFRLGQLLEERLEDSTGAILAYRESVSLDPTQRIVWERLRGLYAARGSWTAVLQVAELELVQTLGPVERVKLIDEMARVWDEELGDAEQAQVHREQAAALRGDATVAATEPSAATEEAAPEPESPADAEPAQEPEPEPAQEPEPEDEDEPLVQQAWLAAARGDTTSAVAALREAMERDPSDIEAIDMLLTVLEGAERHAEMAELLERRAAVAAEKEVRAAVLARLGVVRETQLGDATGAASAHERALAADANHVGSRAALMRLYRSAERWLELRTLLESSIEAAPADARPELLCALAALLCEQFDEKPAAMEAYEQALALDDGHATAREALDALREALETESLEPEAGADEDEAERSANENRSVRVVGVLERKLARIQDEGRDFERPAIKLRLRIAELRSTTLGDTEGAIEMLAPCVHDPESILDVAQRLGFLYERAGRHPELIALARRAAELSTDPEERAGWYRRAAETARSTGDSETAVSFYHCLLGERPNDRNAEAALLELHRARGEAAPLVTLLRSELARVSSREELPLQLELADLLEDALANPAGALPHWRRALALDTSQVEALERALRCAGSDGGAVRQLDLLEYLTLNATDENSRARLLARRGDVMVDSFGWLEEGAESWRRSLEIEPNQPGVRSRLEQAQSQPAA
jgi:tetratricopeptide (TPR) repeat protein